MIYDITRPTPPEMPSLGKGLEDQRLLLSQTSKGTAKETAGRSAIGALLAIGNSRGNGRKDRWLASGQRLSG